MPIGDLARQEDYAVDPLTGIPIGMNRTEGMGDVLTVASPAKNSPVRHRTASPLVNITEGDINDAMRMALAMRRNRMGMLAAQDNYQGQ